MTYDLNGNTLNDGTNSYVWDARNRLASADNNGARFSYDPLGRRVSKTVLSTTTAAASQLFWMMSIYKSATTSDGGVAYVPY
jgi:YD repeat-containing protein